MTLEELQVIITAKTDGLQKQINQVNGKLNGLSNTSNTMASKINSAFGAIKTGVAVYVIKKVTDALISCTNIAGKTETALLGLERILTAQGRSFQGANKFIQEYISDGLIPLQDAIVTYKNLAARGYDNKQIKDIMNRLKDSASFGRQGSLALGEAVKTAAEGLKNENSILVDNAGVTKNVAKMWEEYAASIGKTRDSLTMAEKRTAEYNGIMKETQFQVGDAAAYTKTYDGQVARLGATLITIKTNIGQAFMPIATIVLPLLQSLLNGLATVTSYIASFMKALFGVTATNANMGKTSNNTASSINKIGDNADATGKKLKKAGEQAKGALASFDEINNLDTSKGSGNGEDSGMDVTTPDITPSDLGIPSVEQQVDTLSNKIKTSFDGIKNYFNDIWKDIEPSVNNASSRIFEVVNKNALRFSRDLNKIVISAFDFGERISGPFRNAFMKVLNVAIEIFGSLSASTLQMFYDLTDGIANVFEAELKPLGTILNLLFNSIADYLSNNKQNIVEGFSTAFEEIQTRVSTVFEMISNEFVIIFNGMDEFLKNNSQLISNTLINTWEDTGSILSSIWTMLSISVFTVFDSITDFFKKHGSEINKELLSSWEKISLGLIDLWNSIFNGAKTIFEEMAGFFTKNTGEVKEMLTKTWETTWSIIQPIWRIFSDIAHVIFEALAKFFDDNSSKIGDFITSAWDLAWSIIKPLWQNMLDTANIIFGALKEFWRIWGKDILDYFKANFNALSQFFGGVLDTISGLFKIFSGLFSGNWEKMWEGCKQVFKGVFDSISAICKGIMNDIIFAINFAIGGLNEMKIDVPEWLPKIGGKTFSLNIPKVPYLAQGGYLEANNPTFAVVGDNTTEGEIVAPESKIYEQTFKAITDAMSFSSNMNDDRPIEITLQLGTTSFGKVVIDSINKLQKQAGKTLIEI